MAFEASSAAVVRRFVDALWTRGDDETVHALCEQEVAERLIGWAARVRAGGGDVAVSLDVVVADEGGWVATIQTRTQTHTGDLRGPLVDQLTSDKRIPATNRPISSRSAVFYRVVDGRVVEVANFADNLRFFSQFGRLRLELSE